MPKDPRVSFLLRNLKVSIFLELEKFQQNILRKVFYESIIGIFYFYVLSKFFVLEADF